MNIRLRHDAIVRILRRNGTSTVNDLAGEVGASRRTVLRDIVALRDQGFVIHSESGRGGGLQLDPQSMQPLFTTAGGWVVLGCIAILETTGWLLIRRIVTIDV